jgi:hypothetical protein
MNLAGIAAQEYIALRTVERYSKLSLLKLCGDQLQLSSHHDTMNNSAIRFRGTRIKRNPEAEIEVYGLFAIQVVNFFTLLSFPLIPPQYCAMSFCKLKTIAALSAVLLSVGCHKTERTSPAQGGSQMKIRVGYIGITCEAPIFCAIENGFFKEEGLDVELVKCEWSKSKLSSGR